MEADNRIAKPWEVQNFGERMLCEGGKDEGEDDGVPFLKQTPLLSRFSSARAFVVIIM